MPSDRFLILLGGLSGNSVFINKIAEEKNPKGKSGNKPKPKEIDDPKELASFFRM